MSNAKENLNKAVRFGNFDVLGTQFGDIVINFNHGSELYSIMTIQGKMLIRYATESEALEFLMGA